MAGLLETSTTRGRATQWADPTLTPTHYYVRVLLGAEKKRYVRGAREFLDATPMCSSSMAANLFQDFLSAWTLNSTELGRFAIT